MRQTTRWNIYNVHGKFLGQSAARSAETALCQYMRHLGMKAFESDVEVETLSDDSARLVFGSSEYFVTPQYVLSNVRARVQ
jgi:hypothetical protein